MSKLTTTLNEIKKHSPCVGGWAKLLVSLGKTEADDEPLTLMTILESNGIRDTIEALRAVEGYDNAKRLYACFCARYSLDIFEREHPDDKRLRHTIETAERFARGLASKEELTAAEAAAETATWYTIWYIAEAAAGATVRSSAEVAVEAAVWNAAEAAVRDAVKDIALDAPRDVWNTAKEAAENAAWEHFEKEFHRLINLEGEYGEVGHE